MADKLISVFEERRKNAEAGRKRYELEWKIARHFFSGKQWLAVDRDRRIIDLPNPQDRPRYVINVIPKYVARYQGKLVPDDLRPDVTFRRDDLEAESVADENRRALEFAWDEEAKLDPLFAEASRKRLTYGLSALRVRWDPNYGDVKGEYPIGEDGKPIVNMDEARSYVAESMQAGEIPTIKELRDGRCCGDVFDVWNILPPPGVEHERKFPWLVIVQAVPVQHIRDTYGAAANGIEGEHLQAHTGLGSDGEDLKEHALLYIGYEMPTNAHRQGLEFHWCQMKPLRTREQLPYIIDGEPRTGIEFLKFDVVEGQFWPLGLVSGMVGPQRQMNGMRSGTQESIDRGGWPRVFAEKGWYTEVNRPRGAPFEIIEGTPGLKFPDEFSGTGPGPWIRDEYELAKSDMDMVAGLRGDPTNAPPGTTAFAAFNFFNEQEEESMGEIRKADRQTLKRVAESLLECVGKYWVGDRLLSITNQDDGLMDLVVYNSDRLPRRRFVKLSVQAPISQSPAAESQKILDIYDRSISSGQTLPLDWLFESLLAGKALPMPKREPKVQQDKAEYENLMIAAGMQVVVAPYDNHQIHDQIHAAARTSNEIGGRPDVAQAIELHREQHLMAMQAQAAQAPPSNNGQQPLPPQGAGNQNAGVGPARAAEQAGATDAAPTPAG